MVVERKADSVRKNRSGLFVKSRLISQSNLWPPRWPPSGSLVSLSALFLPKSYDSAISIRTPKCNNWTLLFLHYLFLHRSQHLWEFYLLDLLLSPWFRFVFLLIIIMINIICMVTDYWSASKAHGNHFQLRCHVLWAGKLRASWKVAIARGNDMRQRTADHYKVAIKCQIGSDRLTYYPKWCGGAVSANSTEWGVII